MAIVPWRSGIMVIVKACDSTWDKELTGKLVGMGLDWEKARSVVGLIAEQRQTADHDGYVRGYNNGYMDAKAKLVKSLF